MQLKNKFIILTGASSGIGYDLLTLLLQKGAKVIAASRKIMDIDIDHPNLYKYACDISKKEGVDSLFEYAKTTFGDIDAYIANAGFTYYGKTNNSWQDIQKIFSTNVFSAIYAATKLRELSENRPYNFMITASAMGFISLPGYALYASTKSALRAFGDAYRYELKKGQHFQIVYPIATLTPFFKNAGDIPIAWPRQSSQKVAAAMLKALEKDKAVLYPSKLFILFKWLSSLFPFLSKIYMNFYNKELIKWQKENI